VFKHTPEIIRTYCIPHLPCLQDRADPAHHRAGLCLGRCAVRGQRLCVRRAGDDFLRPPVGVTHDHRAGLPGAARHPDRLRVGGAGDGHAAQDSRHLHAVPAAV